MFREYNPNPKCARVGDCTVRAISKVLRQSWIETYIGLCLQGLLEADMPSANHVWGKYLERKGFVMGVTDAKSVREFAEHSKGRFVVALSGHIVAVVDGDYFDTWDSGGEVPLYIWKEA